MVRQAFRKRSGKKAYGLRLSEHPKSIRFLPTQATSLRGPVQSVYHFVILTAMIIYSLRALSVTLVISNCGGRYAGTTRPLRGGAKTPP
jgi:hypothetical protein